jgi:hypothetical protein
VTRERAIQDVQSGRLGRVTKRPGNLSKFRLGILEDIPEGETASVK